MKCPKCDTVNPDTVKFCGECGFNFAHPEDAQPSFTRTLETPVEALTRGTLFADRYEIIEELGKGGMGAVYRVEDTKVKEEIALKLIKPEIAAEKKTIERFRNELTTARKIAHRNVCKMFDLGEDGGTHFITMEYVPGQDLKGLMRQTGRLAIPAAISIAKQVCEGLSEAHRLGVVHRDLKPANIMIDKEGNARIMDFGIARSLKTKGVTGTGIMIGTPEYMSPEQVEAKEVDQRSDIYSLGVILFEMVTGQLPFDGDTALSIAMKHKSESPLAPNSIDPQIPDDLNDLILRCLKKENEARYQSADQLFSDLTNIEKGIPATQQDITKKKTLTSKEITVTLPSKRIYIPALVVIATALVGLFLWHPWSQKAIAPIFSDRPTVAVLYFENNTGDQELDYLRDVMLNVLITDLNQSDFISVISQDRIFSILRYLKLDQAEKYSTEDLTAISEQSGVSNIVTGSYYSPGDRFIFNISFKKLHTGETVTFSEEGDDAAKVPDIIDSISLRIKSELGLSRAQISSDTDEKAGLIRSFSPDALKYFSQGEKFYSSGEYKKATPLLEAAIAADPNMAMAYRHLAAVNWNTNSKKDDPNFRENMEKAFSLGEHASERERLIIQGGYYLILVEDYEIAEAIFQKLVKKYPDENIGYRSLTVLYIFLGDLTKVNDYAEKAYQTRPDNFLDVNGIIRSHRMAKEYGKEARVLRDFIQKFPEHTEARYKLVFACVNLEKYNLALSEIDKLFQIDPERFNYPAMRAEVYAKRGDLQDAEKEIQKSFNSDNPRFKNGGKRDLAFLYLYQGKKKVALDLLKQTALWWKDNSNYSQIIELHMNLVKCYLATDDPVSALKECEEALSLSLNTKNTNARGSVMYRKGTCFVAMNKLDEAMAVAEDLRQFLETQKNVNPRRLYPMLLGQIGFARENYPQAIELIEKALNMTDIFSGASEIPKGEYIYALAEAYYRSGNPEKARVEYEKIDSLAHSSGNRYDLIGITIYKLGKIYEEQGNKAKAIENYEKFLDLWRDADPGLPEVADARERLSELKE